MLFRLIAVILFIGTLGPAGGATAEWAWKPFEPVRRPPVPAVQRAADEADTAGNVALNPIDAFLREAQRAAGVSFREPATREQWLRRVTLDLTGLAPTPEERAAFLADGAPDAFEKVADRLLASPRYAERWARHWMDIWRYSDWAGWADGKQIRDSQPHIWRWRDWIIEALEADMGYDQMLTDMLAADERAPEDTQALRATGFLVRNYKMLSREQWLEDTVRHTSQAFLGLTVGCAKCHDHMTDPVPQTEYYAMRAIFEPHQVRIDHVPGQADTTLDGLPRVYDANPAVPTHLFVRGNEKQPDTSKVIAPGVPSFLGGVLEIKPVPLPAAAVAPQQREFVRALIEDAARKKYQAAEIDTPVALAQWRALHAVLAVERLEQAGKKDSPEWQEAARAAVAAQREEAAASALHQLITATVAHAEAAQKDAATAAEPAKKLEEARTALAAAQAALAEPPATAYKPRELPAYPAESTGRRLAFARWLASPRHPLTARVAVNHLWARHFGAGLMPNAADFGQAARKPAHPALLDWLAAEFMANGWRSKPLHKLICLSQAYRQSSAETARPAEAAPAAPETPALAGLVPVSTAPRVSLPEAADPAALDPDNTLLWRFPSRRLEAEAVRDNLLYLTGGLDETRGGPEIDHMQALTSGRRSVYLRCAAEKQAEFLQVFDGPSVVECYERKPSVMPQQALALLNSDLAQARARALATATGNETDDAALIRDTFLRLFTREPGAEETAACLAFLHTQSAAPSTPARARELLFLTLLNHHEFLTLR